VRVIYIRSVSCKLAYTHRGEFCRIKITALVHFGVGWEGEAMSSHKRPSAV